MSDPESNTDEARLQPRRALLGAAVVSALGIAVAGTFSRSAGGVILVAGWLALVYALHAFGRSAE